MSSISLLKGQKEILQIEVSRFFVLRFAVQFIRNVRRLLMRSSLLRLVVLLVLAGCVLTYTLFSGQDRFYNTGWLSPDTCAASDCRIRPPLLMAELSPNLLLILIHSSASGWGVRDAIRQTWVSSLNNHDFTPIQYRFLIGGEDVSQSVLNQIQRESEEFQDIIVLPDVTDSLTSLTRRTLLGFKHIHHNFNKFSYIMKCDDDTLVDIMRIASELQRTKQTDRLYWGYMSGGTRLFWIGVYSEYNWFVCDTYLPYALGGGYILSRDLVELLVRNEPFLKMYRCEDTALGAWLAPYNIRIKHDSRFNTNSPSRGCKDPYLVLHKVSSSDMFYYYNSFQKESRYCSWRTNWHSFNGYLYRWDTLPSRCCYKNPDVP